MKNVITIIVAIGLGVLVYGAAQPQSNADFERATAYSCGRAAGMRILIKRFGLGMEMPRDPNPAVLSCAEVRAAAVRAGFKPAIDDAVLAGD